MWNYKGMFLIENNKDGGLAIARYLKKKKLKEKPQCYYQNCQKEKGRQYQVLGRTGSHCHLHTQLAGV